MNNISIHMAVPKDDDRIEGDCQIQDIEKSMVCKAVDYGTSRLYKPEIGGGDVKQRRSSMTIHKRIDRTTSALYQALATGEKLSEVKIIWRKISENGVEAPCFTSVLSDALALNTRPAEYTGGDTEQVTQAYDKIMWTRDDGGN